MRFPFLSVVVVAVLGSSCTEADGNGGSVPIHPTPDGTGTEVASSGISASDRKAMAAAFTLPRTLAAGLLSSRSMVTEGVYFACAQSGAAWTGQITKTGTITISPAGTFYEPSPADRLVVRIGSEVHDFLGIEAEGNAAAGTAISWLQSPHRLRYTHRVGERVSAEIDEQFDGMQFQVSIKGNAELNGTRFEFDLQAKGGTRGEGGADGRQESTAYQITGTVRGDGAEAAIREQHSHEFASAVSLRLLHSQRGWASDSIVAMDSSVRTQTSTWTFAGVRVRTGAKEKGGQQTTDVVSAEGSILRDGKPALQCVLQGDTTMAVGVDESFPLSLPLGR